MGIDKPDVRLVIHHSLPNQLKDIIRKPGARGEMDCRPGACCFFLMPTNSNKTIFINNITDDDEREKAQEILAGYCTMEILHSCRRKFLLNYFNEEYNKENCGNCDRWCRRKAFRIKLVGFYLLLGRSKT